MLKRPGHAWSFAQTESTASIRVRGFPSWKRMWCDGKGQRGCSTLHHIKLAFISCASQRATVPQLQFCSSGWGSSGCLGSASELWTAQCPSVGSSVSCQKKKNSHTRASHKGFWKRRNSFLTDLSLIIFHPPPLHTFMFCQVFCLKQIHIFAPDLIPVISFAFSAIIMLLKSLVKCTNTQEIFAVRHASGWLTNKCLESGNFQPISVSHFCSM